MTTPRINKIEIQGFRAFGKNCQTLAFGAPIAAVWAPNSQGKTSLAEAFEFLLTGQIVRRQLMLCAKHQIGTSAGNRRKLGRTRVASPARIPAPMA